MTVYFDFELHRKQTSKSRCTRVGQEFQNNDFKINLSKGKQASVGLVGLRP